MIGIAQQPFGRVVRDQKTLNLNVFRVFMQIKGSAAQNPDLRIEPESGSSVILRFSTLDYDWWRLFGDDYWVKEEIMSGMFNVRKEVFETSVWELFYEVSQAI